MHRPDVLHVHWPEDFQTRATPTRAAARLALNLTLTAWFKLRGARVAWTAHNLVPQDVRYPRLQMILEETWFRMVDCVLHLTDFSRGAFAEGQARRLRPSTRHCTIRHGTFPTSMAPAPAAIRRGIVMVGQMRGYRRVEDVLAAVEGCSAPESFLLAGAGLVAPTAATLRAKVRPGRLGDGEYEALLGSARASLVIPGPLSNSGSALHSLSLHTPVIALDTPILRELQQEVGENHVFLLAEVSSDELDRALRWLKHRDSSSPPALRQQQWASIGEETTRCLAALRRENRRARR